MSTGCIGQGRQNRKELRCIFADRTWNREEIKMQVLAVVVVTLLERHNYILKGPGRAYVYIRECLQRLHVAPVVLIACHKIDR